MSASHVTTLLRTNTSSHVLTHIQAPPDFKSPLGQSHSPPTQHCRVQPLKPSRPRQNSNRRSTNHIALPHNTPETSQSQPGRSAHALTSSPSYHITSPRHHLPFHTISHVSPTSYYDTIDIYYQSRAQHTHLCHILMHIHNCFDINTVLSSMQVSHRSAPSEDLRRDSSALGVDQALPRTSANMQGCISASVITFS